MMEKQFVPFEYSLKMKKLGFDEPCIAYYVGGEDRFVYDIYTVSNFSGRNVLGGKSIATPLWQQAFDWLFNNLSYICIIENNMSYEQKQEKLKGAIRYIQDNKPK